MVPFLRVGNDAAGAHLALVDQQDVAAQHDDLLPTFMVHVLQVRDRLRGNVLEAQEPAGAAVEAFAARAGHGVGHAQGFVHHPVRAGHAVHPLDLVGLDHAVARHRIGIGRHVGVPERQDESAGDRADLPAAAKLRGMDVAADADRRSVQGQIASEDKELQGRFLAVRADAEAGRQFTDIGPRAAVGVHAHQRAAHPRDQIGRVERFTLKRQEVVEGRLIATVVRRLAH
ncbi:hypothetical protein [Caulobacter sp. UC70_42]|uniref:hypothetical protein n=1 Tax=Caulobacter sp. UC70_42 TaxID=3374551 RepID=UPI0037574C89